MREESRRGKPEAAKLWFRPVSQADGFISATDGA
jgi:hypothetical protein